MPNLSSLLLVLFGTMVVLVLSGVLFTRSKVSAQNYNSQTSQVVAATASPNSVANPSTQSVHELPQTGPSPLELILIGLIPLGWKLTKFGVKKELRE